MLAVTANKTLCKSTLDRLSCIHQSNCIWWLVTRHKMR